MQTLDQYSRSPLIATNGDQPSNEQIKLGCLQRIATATEAMANHYNDLIDDVERYKKCWKEQEEENIHLGRVIAELRGTINRMKRKSQGKDS